MVKSTCCKYIVQKYKVQVYSKKYTSTVDYRVRVFGTNTERKYMVQ